MFGGQCSFLHLANALGVPLVALFGPTNPTRTGPVFSAPVQILRPEAGSTQLADLRPQAVVAAARVLLDDIQPSLTSSPGMTVVPRASQPSGH